MSAACAEFNCEVADCVPSPPLLFGAGVVAGTAADAIASVLVRPPRASSTRRSVVSTVRGLASSLTSMVAVLAMGGVAAPECDRESRKRRCHRWFTHVHTGCDAVSAHDAPDAPSGRNRKKNPVLSAGRVVVAPKIGWWRANVEAVARHCCC